MISERRLGVNMSIVSRSSLHAQGHLGEIYVQNASQHGKISRNRSFYEGTVIDEQG